MRTPEENPEPSGDLGKEKKAGSEDLRKETDELLEAARKRGLGLLDRQKQAAVDELQSVAGVMRDAAQRFRERKEESVGSYVERAAETVERVSSTLRDRNLKDIFREAEQALRRRPAVFLGATAVVGFAIGRFLRAGGQRIAGAGEGNGSGAEEAGPGPETGEGA